MRILELMGMSSTKYGGLEKFNRTLMENRRKINSYLFMWKTQCVNNMLMT